LKQVSDLRWSAEVGAGRYGCCTNAAPSNDVLTLKCQDCRAGRDRLTGPEADRYGPSMGLFSRTKKVTSPDTVTPPEVPDLVGVDPSWAALPTLSHGKSEGLLKLSGPSFYR
jgi:hypothetical protein